MANIFENVKGMTNSTAIVGELTMDDVQIIESKVENAKVTQFSWGSFFIILLMVILFGMGLISVIISTFKHHTESDTLLDEPELLDNNQDILSSDL